MDSQASNSQFPSPPIAPTKFPPVNNTLSPTKAPWSTTEVPSNTSQNKGSMEAIQVEPRMPSVASSSATYQPARKKITSQEELKFFLSGKSIKSYMAFILALNEGVTGKRSVNEDESSEAVKSLLNVLSLLWTWVDEIPPVQQSLRYGNPAYRTWFAKMSENAISLIENVLPETCQGAAIELATYFADSFGNATRIDYGTGHEATFCAFLYCLATLGVFTENDKASLVLVIFKKYLQLMRKVQTTYWLEPAGSHGVWGLDDYQFLPFIWGSAQLINHPMIKPKSIHNNDILEMYSEDYLYLGCIKFTLQVKKGPLAETSPIINDISSVPTWTKVNGGLLKMFQVEVLSKLPIMQHFLFGSLLPFE